ncbi:antirestriction protein ArdA [Enterococcus sp. LJL90]
MSEIKIYVELLGQKQKGEWFSLPVAPSIVSQKLGVDDSGNEEIIISDYEAPFRIRETDRIVDLKAMVEQFKAMPAEFQKHAKYLIDEYYTDVFICFRSILLVVLFLVFSHLVILVDICVEKVIRIKFLLD